MNVNMKTLTLLLSALTLSCCTHNISRTSVHSTPPSSVINKVTKKCRVVKPKQPAPLNHPLPLNDSQKLINILTDKLTEWAGPGGYGDKAEKALNNCSRNQSG